jgi:radical SAM family uncharacterized protein/radical SAM-linked protein
MPLEVEASTAHPYAGFLARLQKPARYVGSEEQAVVKSPSAALACRFVLAFPDLYEVGMSHLGTRILYDLVNRADDLVCERAFSPWGDLERELRARGLPLVSLETHTALRDFDVVGVSLQYELSYTNVLLNLDLGGIPLRASDRGDRDPIVVAGGPTATHPEPLADFVDLFLVGEAEDVLPELLRTIGRMRRAGVARAEILAAAARGPGIYAPRFYRVEPEPRTGLWVVAGRTPEGEAAGVPDRVARVWVADLARHPFPTRFPVPYAEAIFDRASVEITRGCTEGCRFCQAGMIYRPVRERSPDEILRTVLEGTDAAGFSEASLTALSTADVSCIDPLIKALVPELARRKVSLGVASLRAYGLSEDLLDQINKVGIDGLTFAPEAGTQRMRDVINKNVSEEDILESARRIFSRGYERMKLYFILGLPTETEADVVGIVETGRRLLDVARTVRSGRRAQITVSVSQHVPKPHTPFQWAAMDTIADLEDKVALVREQGRRAGLTVKTHSVHESWLECLFARGDRRMGRALELAYRAGARFDGWRECFSFDRWLDALEQAGIEPDRYTSTLPVGVPLPWSHIDVGLAPGFLEREWRKAARNRVSPPCGKPFGDQVHHATLDAALAERRRLVCYDCGVACDLTQMRDERIVALRTLAQRPTREPAAEPFVPADRLSRALPRSVLPEGSAFKPAAEAPASRLRLFFAKEGPLVFLGHLDLVRMLPRMFRRARIELAFSRGFHPTPRMSFPPALALGMTALEEALDCDVILPESAADLAAPLPEAERRAVARGLLERLRSVAPTGLHLLDARLVAPGERRLGELVVGADYSVAITSDQAGALERRLPDVLAADALWVERRPHDRKPARVSAPRRVDVRPHLLRAEVDRAAGRLRFRVGQDARGASARPRELVTLMLGEAVADHLFCREQLLARRDPEGLVGLRGLGPVHRRAAGG